MSFTPSPELARLFRVGEQQVLNDKDVLVAMVVLDIELCRAKAAPFEPVLDALMGNWLPRNRGTWERVMAEWDIKSAYQEFVRILATAHNWQN
jgi:hypothetical protein